MGKTVSLIAKDIENNNNAVGTPYHNNITCLLEAHIESESESDKHSKIGIAANNNASNLMNRLTDNNNQNNNNFLSNELQFQTNNLTFNPTEKLSCQRAFICRWYKTPDFSLVHTVHHFLHDDDNGHTNGGF